MDVPAQVSGSVISEGELFFFTPDCPIGIRNHIHICIKRNKRILLLTTCSSKTDTAYRLAIMKGLDINTFPVFTKNETNKFTKDQTYVNCNNVITVSEHFFGQLIHERKVIPLEGHIDPLGLGLIANGIKKSPEVERWIKDLL